MKKSGIPAHPSGSVAESQLVVVAVDSDRNSHHALRWAADNIIDKNQLFVLLHVRRKAGSSNAANYLPLEDIDDEDGVDGAHSVTSDMFTKELLLPFQCFCSKRGLQCKEVILEDTDIPRAILNFISLHIVDKLVLGAASRNAFTRAFLTDVPYAVSKAVPDFCSLYVISKGKISSVRVAPQPHYFSSKRPPLELDNAGSQFQSVKSVPEIRNHNQASRSENESSNRLSAASCPSPSVRNNAWLQNNYSQELMDGVDRTPYMLAFHSDQRNHYLENGSYSPNSNVSSASKDSGSSGSNRSAAFSLKAIENHGHGEARLSESLASLEALEQNSGASRIDEEQNLLPTKMDFTNLLTGVRYRRYSMEEIKNATNNFSNSLKIGEGGYGPVFKSTLDHTLVAIKTLRSDATQGSKQFQQEVEVLSCIRHPNMVLLMGACPEYGCLVYEYMANGSLEDRLFCRSNSPPLSWQLRFKVAAEVATGILFLHDTKPEPFVHRDLKPGNILLDINFVTKIADVGLARLIPPSVAEQTMYHMTAAAGTFCYIDPEYQKSGMLGTKSDIYALGIILLQLITAAPPMGLAHNVEDALETGRLARMLDPRVPDWPMEETLRFAKLALKCAELRRRDRPDLGSVVLPELNRLREFALSMMSGPWVNTRRHSRSNQGSLGGYSMDMSSSAGVPMQ